MYPLVNDLVCFLSEFYIVLDLNEVAFLDAFIEKYKASDIASIKKYVGGLIRDYEYVKNCFIHPDISNGPTEGLNNYIKTLKSRSYGRARPELMNAYATLDCIDGL